VETPRPTLIAADIGNVNTRHRQQGGAWEIELSLGRMLSRNTSYSTTTMPYCPELSGRAALRPGNPAGP
jgi:hypothetical protein